MRYMLPNRRERWSSFKQGQGCLVLQSANYHKVCCVRMALLHQIQRSLHHYRDAHVRFAPLHRWVGRNTPHARSNLLCYARRTHASVPDIVQGAFEVAGGRRLDVNAAALKRRQSGPNPGSCMLPMDTVEVFALIMNSLANRARTKLSKPVAKRLRSMLAAALLGAPGALEALERAIPAYTPAAGAGADPTTTTARGQAAAAGRTDEICTTWQVRSSASGLCGPWQPSTCQPARLGRKPCFVCMVQDVEAWLREVKSLPDWGRVSKVLARVLALSPRAPPQVAR